MEKTNKNKVVKEDINSQKQNQNMKMGTEPVLRLIITMSLPAMVSMLVQACYNVVDSIFVAQIGEEALAAVSIAFPIQILIIALMVGMGVGINSAISRRLGEGNMEDALFAAEHGFVLSGILSLVCVVLGLTAVVPFLRMFAGTGNTFTMATGYATIVTVFAFGSIICQAGFAMLQGSGDMIQPMIGQLLGAIANIILDPIFIFGLLGVPAMGVNGAAIATVIGQILAMLYILIICLFRKSNLLHIDFSKFRYKPRIMGDIIQVGIPAAIMQGIGSVMLTGYNFILATYGTTALAVFGVYFKVQSFVFMPIFGLGQGIMPIFGYNFGARNRERFMETMKYSVIISVIIMLLGLVMFQAAPGALLSMFAASDNMQSIGQTAFRAISWSFPFAGIAIVISNAFQAMGKSYISMIASILRQLVVLLPVTWVLSSLGGLDMLWYGFIIAELVCLAYLILTFLHYKKKILDTWPVAVEVAVE